MAPRRPKNFLRQNSKEPVRVSNLELFFDLLYVFAVTQLSHTLLQALTLTGMLQALILCFAVWLGWQYTAWVTNWFDPEKLPVRALIFAIMPLGLLMASAIPEAFANRGLMFAICYVGIQIGRTLVALFFLGNQHKLTANFERILAWLCISAIFWIVGGLAEESHRLMWWTTAVACEYFSPMIGFWFPFLGRSETSEWDIEGAHLAERCQLFIIVALGESILETGTTLSGTTEWTLPIILAVMVTFIGSLAMWWIYFDTSSEDGSKRIENSNDPGKIGAYFHYIHVTLVAGIILFAVANELTITKALNEVTTPSLMVLIGGPVLYLIGNALYKKIIYRRYLISHLVGILLLIGLSFFAHLMNMITMSTLSVLILIGVALADTFFKRVNKRAN